MDTLDYKEPITKIYFVRHGQTKANKLQLLFGHLDWDLTKEGIKQANNSAIRLAKITRKERIDYIISSPLKRAEHTAKIIAKKLNIKKILRDKNLMEKSEGLWEGKSFWEVRKKDLKNYYKWLKNPFKIKPPKGESVMGLNKRVEKFYKTVSKKYTGKNIIVVTHSGPIRLFILNLLKATIDKFWYLKVECGSITEIHLSKRHSMVWSMNK
ncbi:MAG: histidine phosphatase family protein [Candidatus Melainabacteria bacterium]|nr:histidine phosphatase family protein [Candidatus Melainabacteria bacterium]